MKDIPHICGVSVMKSVFARHMKIHDDVAQFRCEICDKRFKTKDYLSQHKKTHRKPEDIQCPSCQAVLHSKSALGMNKERYFGGDAMVGNRLHKGYVSIRGKDYTLTQCFQNHPETRAKFNTLWEILSKVDTFLALRDPTPEQIELGAQECAMWCNKFSQFFLTRKW